MNISFFLIFYHLIRLLVKALQCELVIFQKELFCGDSLVVDALMEKYQNNWQTVPEQAGGLHRAILRTVPCSLKRLHSLWRIAISSSVTGTLNTGAENQIIVGILD